MANTVDIVRAAAEEALRRRIVSGFDYYTGLVIRGVIETPEPTLEHLVYWQQMLNLASQNKAEHKATFVRLACRDLRREYAQTQPSQFHFNVLDIIETSAAALAVRKLLELFRVTAFPMRQLRIPGT